jgi:hypothetical protein
MGASSIRERMKLWNKVAETLSSFLGQEWMDPKPSGGTGLQ